MLNLIEPHPEVHQFLMVTLAHLTFSVSFILRLVNLLFCVLSGHLLALEVIRKLRDHVLK